MTRNRADPKVLFYITHINNLPSIIEHGILSHAEVETRNLEYTPIYDSDIVSSRANTNVDGSKTLWNFANLYFQPRNAMLYRVLHEKGDSELAIVAVHSTVSTQEGVFISTENAASEDSEILAREEGWERVQADWQIIDNEWWNSSDGSKRIMMAECLVPECVAPEYIHSIYVANYRVAELVRQMRGIPTTVIPVPEPHMFFRPSRPRKVTELIALGDRDMFFSTMQTLTVSVNLRGIMGRGLASRTKYQFPDVYVTYQDACRKKTVRVDKPYLYKREAHIAEELADDPSTLTPTSSQKWFLLFATKRLWRDDSRLDDIEAGLAWIKDNYKSERIQSLALPALGCGLGGLEWRVVGPLMCRYLSSLDIPVRIYLPRETKVPDEQMEPQFLLGS